MLEPLKLNQEQMALLLKSIEKHLKGDDKYRIIPWQIGIHPELFARLMEACPKQYIDTFITQMFCVGLETWFDEVVNTGFQGKKELVDELVNMACDEERDGSTVH